MKRWFLLFWLLIPLPVVVWHYGPGQQFLARDQAHALIRRAEKAEAKKDWPEAEKLFQAAADSLRNTEPRLKTQLDIALVRMRYRQGRDRCRIIQVDLSSFVQAP